MNNFGLILGVTIRVHNVNPYVGRFGIMNIHVFKSNLDLVEMWSLKDLEALRMSQNL